MKTSDQLAISMQFIALETALESFEESNKQGDESVGNRSYRGMCIVDMVRYNNRLGKWDKIETAKKLNYANELLGGVLREKLREAKEYSRKVKESLSKLYSFSSLKPIPIALDDSLNMEDSKPKSEEKNEPQRKRTISIFKGKLIRGEIYKDFRRLAECQFRLADVIWDINERRRLYKSSIKNNLGAKSLLEENDSVNPEVFSFIASSHYKLAEISSENKRRRNIEDALDYFERAFMSGDDKSAENRSKKGSCYLKLLEIELEEKSSTEEINQRVKETKETLEKAVEINGKGDFVYPLFLLASLSQRIIQGGGDLRDYGLKIPREYIGKALESYNENNPNWNVKEINGCRNLVYQTFDNYGLLSPFFLMKKGKSKYLEKEIENTKKLNQELENEFGKDRKFYTIDPLAIISRSGESSEDEGEKYYFMSRISGKTLEKLIDRKDSRFSNILEDVVRYLGFIHGRMPKGEAGFEYESFIEKKLGQLGIDPDVIKNISENYSPIRDDLKSGLFVFNKDAHTRNWLINEGDMPEEYSVYAIDLEGKKDSVPAEIDLASLLEYANITSEEKKRFFQIYKESLSKYMSIDSFSGEICSERRYLNASFSKAISMAPWPTITWERKIKILRNARENLEKIKEVDADYYQKFSANYDNLLDGLGKVIDFVGSDNHQ